jgi:hypothetical protein
VKIINLREGDVIASVMAVPKSEEEEAVEAVDAQNVVSVETVETVTENETNN